MSAAVVAVTAKYTSIPPVPAIVTTKTKHTNARGGHTSGRHSPPSGGTHNRRQRDMIKEIEYGKRVETTHGYIETYRNEAGEQVLAICNKTRSEDARVAFDAQEIADIVAMIQSSEATDEAAEEDVGDSGGFGLHTDMILGENPDMLRQD